MAIQTLDFTPVQRDVVHRMGATVYIPFAVSANGSLLDMTSWSVTFKVRPDASSAKVLLAGTLNVTNVNDSNMEWVIQSQGGFAVNVSATAFPNTIFPSGQDVLNAVWDIYATAADAVTVYPITYGNWVITRQVDR
jgi:hypothetical protein